MRSQLNSNFKPIQMQKRVSIYREPPEHRNRSSLTATRHHPTENDVR